MKKNDKVDYGVEISKGAGLREKLVINEADYTESELAFLTYEPRLLEGWDKEYSYDLWWLPKDMENMSYIFEYCEDYCKELFNVKIDRMKFMNAFMRANIRLQMETGHPQLLSEAAITTVERFVEVDLEGNLDFFKAKRGRKKYYSHYQWFWVGRTYAYLHYYEDILSRDLVEIFTIEEMLQFYVTGHQLSDSSFHERAQGLLRDRRKKLGV